MDNLNPSPRPWRPSRQEEPIHGDTDLASCTVLGSASASSVVRTRSIGGIGYKNSHGELVSLLLSSI